MAFYPLLQIEQSHRKDRKDKDKTRGKCDLITTPFANGDAPSHPIIPLLLVWLDVMILYN